MKFKHLLNLLGPFFCMTKVAGETFAPTGPTIKPSSPPTPFSSPVGAVYTGYKLDVSCDVNTGQMTVATVYIVGKCIPQYDGPSSQFIYWIPSSESSSWAHFVVSSYNDAICGSLSYSYSVGASGTSCYIGTWGGYIFILVVNLPILISVFFLLFRLFVYFRSTYSVTMPTLPSGVATV